MKKILSIAVIFVLLAFTGCAKRSTETPQVPTPTPQPPDVSKYMDSLKFPGEEKNLPVIDVYSPVEWIGTSPDRKMLAMVTEYENHAYELLLYSMEKRKLIARTRLEHGGCTWSLDSKMVAASGNKDIVVMDASGKVTRLKTKRGAGELMFRAKDSTKLLFWYGINNPPRYDLQISEIDLKTGKQRNLVRASTNFAGFTHFRGYDCYSDTDRVDTGDAIVGAHHVMVKRVDGGKTMLSMPAGIASGASGICVDFSPDSRWIALQWGDSDMTFMNIASVRDVNRFMREPYVAAYYDSDASRVEWSTEKGKGTIWALVKGSAATVVELLTGEQRLRQYPDVLSTLWTNDQFGPRLVIVDRRGMRIDALQLQFADTTMVEYCAENPDRCDCDPDLGMIAKFRIKHPQTDE